MMQEQSALPVHANSTDAASAGSLKRSASFPPATCSYKRQPGCTSAVLCCVCESISVFTEKCKISKDDTWSRTTKSANPNEMGTIPWGGWSLPGAWLALLSSVVFHFNQVSTEGVCACVCVSSHDYKCSHTQKKKKICTFVC